MLLSLHVKNLALIDETEVFFEPGLNILTGETGAGKSVLVGSINLALGAKAEKDMIRTGADCALVELLFQTEEKQVLQKMKEFDIPVEDSLISISRRIQAGRSVCRINGETVNVRQVRELSELLIDIHGQHEHQSLLHKKKHLEILDSFAGEELEVLKEKISREYQEYQNALKELQSCNMDEEEKRRTVSLLEFELDEIEQADLQPGEDEKLEQSYRKMSNLNKIAEAMSSCCCMTGDGEGAGSGIGRALREILSVASYDTQLEELAEELKQIDSLLSDFNRSANDYMDNLEIDSSLFSEVEERLNLINHLKDKYGQSIEAVIQYGEKQREKLNQLEDYDVYIKELEQKKNRACEKLQKSCEEATVLRKKYAKELEKELKDAICELNFLTVQFEIRVSEKENFSENGKDDVEFLISTNPGEALKPLSQVASGGELSRIMLAIKTVLAERDSIDTLIFDEIDAGISGKTAWKVSRKLGTLGKSHQVISITHLPQIAAMADTHFKIEKTSDGNTTRTEIFRMQDQESVKEIARLLGSENVTEASLENAQELKKLARETK